MFATEINEKIYNLSAGKSLPEVCLMSIFINYKKLMLKFF